MLRIYTYECAAPNVFKWRIYATNRRKAERELRWAKAEYVAKYGERDPERARGVAGKWRCVEVRPNKK